MEWLFGAWMLLVLVLIVPVTKVRMKQRPQDFEITHPRLMLAAAVAFVVLCGVLLTID